MNEPCPDGLDERGREVWTLASNVIEKMPDAETSLTLLALQFREQLRLEAERNRLKWQLSI